MFHVWRSFHYDENAETIDAYVNRIKQVAVLLNYGEPQILEIFKNTLPSKLYWILFSINNLRDAIDATKRELTKEKIDKQLSGQSGTTTPFIKVGDVSHSSKKVSFNMHDPIKEKLENLTSFVYNMSIQKEENNRPFKPTIYPKRGRGQGRQNFSNRDRNRSYNRDRQGQNFGPNYRAQLQNRCIQCGNDSRRGSYRHQNYNKNRNDSRDRGRQHFRSFSNERSRSRERSLTPRGNSNRRYDNPSVNVGIKSRSNSRVTTNRDRIRCFRCREYDHFANEYPNVGTDDSDGYESDRAALQLMTTEADIHDNFDTARHLD